MVVNLHRNGNVEVRAMVIRKEIEDLAVAGPLPSEDSATQKRLEVLDQLLEQVVPPVTDGEAQTLLSLFGPDDCFGMAWTVLHLIETAPSSRTADYSRFSENEWVMVLEERQTS